MSVIRHYFPGNNTPKGFFSYYEYVLTQKEAAKIICIKGGPGTGKSTLLKKIGSEFEREHDVDYLHCSADEASLDGIVIRDKNIALLDGTSPHIVDPITPGAVDKIINLGEYWDENKIKTSKDEIIRLNDKCSVCYKHAYDYLASAAGLFSSLEEIYSKSIATNEIYTLCNNMIKEEFDGKTLKLIPGSIRKFFASAITANGNINYIDTLLTNIDRIYMINNPVGHNNNSFMDVIKDSALYRGYDIECYYCPMKPKDNIEHILIPELSLAFVTTNSYHDVEPWQILNEENYKNKDIILLDMVDYMDAVYLENNRAQIDELNEDMSFLMNKSAKYLGKAKKYHLEAEKYYVNSMNFDELNKFVDKVIYSLI